MKKTILTVAVATFAAFSTDVRAETDVKGMPNLGLCHKLIEDLETTCGKESGMVAKYQCKGGAYMTFGLCKAVTAGLGATEHAEAQKACSKAKNKKECDEKLERLMDHYTLTVIKQMTGEEREKLKADLAKAVRDTN